MRGGVFLLCLALCQTVLPQRHLLLQLRQPSTGLLATLVGVADFGLQLANFSRSLVHLGLRRVDRLACGVMRLTDGFHARFGGPQIGHLPFHGIDGLQHIGLQCGLVALRLLAAQQPLLLLALAVQGAQTVVLRGDFGLLFQMLKVIAQLTQNVVDPRHVFACVVQAVFGFAAALFVFGYACGFF